jgi:plasmid maintenance system antidote protein VapI
MSLRLSAALGTSPEFWLKMQMQCDLWQAQKAKQPKIRPFPHVKDHRIGAGLSRESSPPQD